MKKIGIYGGSFDPPHKGHLLLAENLRRVSGVDTVIIVPAAMSPFKSTSGASAEDRLEMCRRTFVGDEYEISDIELLRGGKSYTVDTVREIKDKYPQAELYLFMGDDMLLSFDRWYKFREISDMCTIVASCRTQELDKLNAMKSFIKDVLGDDGGNKAIICESVPIEISSTEIRRQLSKSGSTYVTDDAYEYIRSRGLYGE